MLESRTYGFVRGALSNERPYRVRFLLHCMSPKMAQMRSAGMSAVLRRSLGYERTYRGHRPKTMRIALGPAQRDQCSACDAHWRYGFLGIIAEPL